MNGLLLLALALSGMVLYALVSDQVLMRGTFSKEEHPKTYWFATIFYAVAALVAFALYLKISGS